MLKQPAQLQSYTPAKLRQERVGEQITVPTLRCSATPGQMVLQVKRPRRWACQRSALKNLSVVRVTPTNSVIPVVGLTESLRMGAQDTTTKTSSTSLHNRNQINQTIIESAVAENISKLRHNQLSDLNLPKTTKPSTMTKTA